ncbi:MAG: hypothetical protein ACREAC_04920, partial [Blastocatellia bacterium]
MNEATRRLGRMTQTFMSAKQENDRRATRGMPGKGIRQSGLKNCPLRTPHDVVSPSLLSLARTVRDSIIRDQRGG